MKYPLYLIIVLLTYLSCNLSNNGILNIKNDFKKLHDTTYFGNGNIKSIIVKNNDGTVLLYQLFNKIGEIEYERIEDLNNHCYWEKLYKRQYVETNEILEDSGGNKIVNKVIIQNHQGDTINNLSNYFYVRKLKDTFIKNTYINPVFYLPTPYFKNNKFPKYSVYVEIENTLDSNYLRVKDFITISLPIEIDLGVIPIGKYKFYMSIEERKNIKKNRDSIRTYLIDKEFIVK